MRVSMHGRRAARAVVVLALAAGAVTGLSLSAFSDPAPVESDKPVEPSAPEGATVPPPPPIPGEEVDVPEPFTVPAATTPPSGVTCPRGWTWFDNPVMHYGLCVPPGWGFTDFTSAAPLEEIPSRMLEGLHLVSARAFPWRPGDFPFDAVRQRGVIDVELNLLEPGVRAVDECEPLTPRLVSGLAFLSCEQTYDSLGLPTATGLLRAIKVAVPLLRAPQETYPGLDLTGARLLVIARTSPTTPVKEVEQLWRLIDSIRPS